MCGIAGIIQAGSDGVAAAMAGRLRHRGPDGSGEWACEDVSLSHRRLSIIDLAGGKQPLHNEDASVHVTYNGELYNFHELRDELRGLGHTFTTASDTEVVVHAWEEWGRDCVERFRGMFAFAIWDMKKRQLFLARDRAGIKPLFYCRAGSLFAFASELQAFAAIPELTRTLDREALDLYLHFQYIPAPFTIFKEIRKLPPAHTLLVSPDSEPDVRRYWELKFEPETGLSENDWIDRLDAVISESVRLHLVSDVPFGAFLSGGVDSSLVTSYMSEHLREEHVRTYSIGFDDPEFDELSCARIVSEHLKTTHREEVVHPDALAILPELVRHYGEPFADSSAIPTYYVSRLAAQNVKMVLSGDGGDEAFAGYASYAFMAREHRPARGFHRRARFLLGQAGRRAKLLPPLPDPRRTWFAMVAGFDEAARADLWRVKGSEEAAWRWFAKEAPVNGTDLCSRFQGFDLRHYLPDDILTKVDIASMCHSLEVRVPLLDHVVLETAARVPVDLRLKSMGVDSNGMPRFETKYILKKVAERRVPREVIWREKKGFSIPLARWTHGALGTLAEEWFGGSDARVFEYFEPQAVRSAIRNPRQVWALVFLEAWFREMAS